MTRKMDYEGDSEETIRKRDPGGAEKLDYELLVKYTDNFSEENFVGSFQFGKVYRAKFPRISWMRRFNVIVKIWEVPETYENLQRVNLARVMNEFILLRHEKLIQHPGLTEFYGFCWDDEHLCAVYYFSPLDTVYNLIPKDSFTWLQRIKVALGFAHLLKFLHTGSSRYKPFLVRNIAAAHLLVDKDYNPKLYDFGMITGGIFPYGEMYECSGCYGYVDPNIDCSGKWSKKTDVFAFGVVLLNLITKRVDTKEDQDRPSDAPLLYCWAWSVFESCASEDGSKNSTCLLVDQSLTTDPDFSDIDGREVTNLAMKCINRNEVERPTMKQVVKCLQKLQVTKKHAKFMGFASKM